MNTLVKKIIINGFVSYAALLLFSCGSASGSKAANPFVTMDKLSAAGPFAPLFAPLAEGGDIYVAVDVSVSRPVLDALDYDAFGVSREDAATVLDKTDLVAAALYPSGTNFAPPFIVCAQGNFPKGLADFALGIAPDWNRQKSAAAPVSYWNSKRGGLSLALNKKYALVSAVDPFAPTAGLSAPGAAFPQGFGAFMDGAAVALWMRDPQTRIDAFLEKLGVPFTFDIVGLFFKVEPTVANNSGTTYNVVMRLETSGEEAAAGAQNLFAIAGMFVSRSGGILQGDAAVFARKLFATPPERDGAFLTVRMAALSADQTALLFNMFSVK